MNTLESILQNDLIEAMKSHDEIRIGAIRSVKTAIQNEKTNGVYHELTDVDIIKIIQKQVKQRNESILVYSLAGRKELEDKETAEKEILETYVPKVLTEDELKTACDKILATFENPSMKDMGTMIKSLNELYPNQIDGRAASIYIKNKLN